jgi:hypothetical protein
VRRLLPVLLAAIALLATGCFKVDLAIKVKEDGSGDIRTVEAIDVDALRRLGPGPDADVDELVPRVGALPPGITADPYQEGSYQGVELRARFDGTAELEERLADIGRALDRALPTTAGPSTQPVLRAFRLEPTPSGGWAFSGLGVDVAGSGSGSGSGLDEDLPPELGYLSDQIRVRLAVTLPGRPVDQLHNADEVKDGNTFVWELTARDTRRRLYAETLPGVVLHEPGPPVLPWVLAGVLVLLGAGALVVGLRQRGRPAGTGGRRGPGGASSDAGDRRVAPSPTGADGWPLTPPTAAPGTWPSAPRPTAGVTDWPSGSGPPSLPPRRPPDLGG